MIRNVEFMQNVPELLMLSNPAKLGGRPERMFKVDLKQLSQEQLNQLLRQLDYLNCLTLLTQPSQNVLTLRDPPPPPYHECEEANKPETVFFQDSIKR